MSQSPAVSIIIPAYNSEATIDRCVESVLAQTLKALEVIIIDDGSSDKTGILCDYLSHRDQRVKVIHKRNEGCSAARNDGIAIAKGVYIGFIDSDDYVEAEMYEQMYQLAIEYNLDVVEVGFKRVFGDENRITYPDDDAPAPNVTNKIFRRSLIDKYGISFPVSSHMGEDLAFSIKVDLVADNKKNIKIAPYVYILSKDSVSHKVIRRFDIYDSIDDLLAFIELIKTKRSADVSGIIYRHGFELPLFNIQKSPNRKKYLDRLISDIFKYRRHLTSRHKFSILRILAARYLEFNYEKLFALILAIRRLLKPKANTYEIR